MSIAANARKPMVALLSMVKGERPCTTPCLFKAHLPTAHSHGSTRTYKNPYITSMTVLFHPNGSMFNNVDTTNVITNSNDETVTIPAGYYTLSEIIALLNTMSDTLFSISTNASSFGCIWIQSPIRLISRMHLTFVRSSAWMDERSFCLLRSTVRT